MNSLSNDVLGCVFEHLSPQIKVLPKWAEKIFKNKLKYIKRRTLGLDYDIVILEIMNELDDIWRFGNSAVLNFFYRNIKSLFGDFILWHIIDDTGLSKNPEAIDLLEKFILPYYPDLGNWNNLSTNPSAMGLINTNWEKVNPIYLSANPKAGKLIKQNFEQSQGKDIEWRLLSKNSSAEAIEMLEKNQDKIDWMFFCENRNPDFLNILEKNLDKIDWEILSFNPAAVTFLEKNLNKVDWRGISHNEAAFHIIEKNLDKVDWDMLSLNGAAVPLLTKNLERVNWRLANKNPAFVPILEKMNESGHTTAWNDLSRVTRIFWKELATNPNLYIVDRKARMTQKERFIKKMSMC
jgi:hypothetical protein